MRRTGRGDARGTSRSGDRRAARDERGLTGPHPELQRIGLLRHARRQAAPTTQGVGGARPHPPVSGRATLEGPLRRR
jgi:hypothetical protein